MPQHLLRFLLELAFFSETEFAEPKNVRDITFSNHFSRRESSSVASHNPLSLLLSTPFVFIRRFSGLFPIFCGLIFKDAISASNEMNSQSSAESPESQYNDEKSDMKKINSWAVV